MAKLTSKSGKDGRAALNESIKKYLKAVEKDTESSMKTATIFVEGETKRNISKIKSTEDKLIDTGRMLNSITSEVETKGNSVRGFVGTNNFYTKFHELGTRNIPARPFLRPALLNNINEVSRILGRGLNKAARRVDKK